MPVRFGKYILLHQLAVGGMAEIYLAKQTGLEGFEKLVVLKKILEEMTEEREFVEMFVNEARIAARLNHPNIVQIYDLGRVGRSYFIAMEYVHGEDLRSISRASQKHNIQLPFEHVCKVMCDVLQGLHFAHTRTDVKGEPLRIVHRDVSPQNILISYDGSVKIVDFGIAKATVTPKTQAGVIKGKYAYMSPEQCSSRPIDGRADVFSVGVILYEFCTGQRLFKRDTDFATLKAITDAPVPSPRSIVPDLPEALEAIILKALERDLDKRYASAQDMQLDLEELLRKGQYQTGNVAIARLMRDLFSDKLAAQANAIRNSRVDSFEALLMEEPNLEPSIITGIPADPEEKSGITPAPLVGSSGPLVIEMTSSASGGMVRTSEKPTPAEPASPGVVPAPPPAAPPALPGVLLPAKPLLLGAPKDPGESTLPPAHDLDSHALTLLQVGPSGELPADERETQQLEPSQLAHSVTVTGVPSSGSTATLSRPTLAGTPPAAEPGSTRLHEAETQPGLLDRESTHKLAATPVPGMRVPTGPTTLTSRSTSVAGLVFFGALALVVLAGVGVLLGKALLGGEALGDLIVRTNPPGAVIELDGLRMQARTPAQLSAVRADVDHRLRLTLSGFRSWEQTVRPARKGVPTVTVQADLRPEKAALWLTSEPSAADVLLDGELRGKTPLLLVQVEPGRHRLELRRGELGHVEEALELADGELRQLKPRLAPLAPPRAHLTLRTSSPAVVRLGERELGTTPLSKVEVPAGKLELLLKWRVRRRVRQKRVVLELAPGKELVHAIDLARE